MFQASIAARALTGVVLLPLLGLLGPGCASGETAPDDPGPAGAGEFVAFAPDFQSLLDWPRHPIDRPPIPMVHESGKYLVFINRPPPAGATEFPVGTIIAKIPQGRGETFAMAKRGGTYNSRGARGWEWFELKAQADGSWAIAWRGITPPEGCGYSGIVGGGCNVCHSAAAANDYVQTPTLQLAAPAAPP